MNIEPSPVGHMHLLPGPPVSCTSKHTDNWVCPLRQTALWFLSVRAEHEY